MTSEDPFTLIRWDREEKEENQNLLGQDMAIAEESEPGQSEQATNGSGGEPPLETSTIALGGGIGGIGGGGDHGNTEEQQEPSDMFPNSEGGGPIQESLVVATHDDGNEGNIGEESKEAQQQSENFDRYTIDVRVSQPISDKDGNSKSFISYLITTVTNHPAVMKLSGAKAEDEEDSSSSSVVVKVRRRYGDFRFLHDCLVNDYPECLVAPLPGKLNFKYLTGDTFSTAFVHKRMHSLDRFVKYVCLHRYLSQLAVFHYFISDSGEWSTFTKNLKVGRGIEESGESGGSGAAAGGLGVMGKVVNEELLTETVMNFFTLSKHKRETNKDILAISDKLKKLYENLVKLDKIFCKLNKKNSDLRSDYEQFSGQINKLALVHSNTMQANETAQVDADRSIQSTGGDQHYVNKFRIFLESLMYFSQHWGQLHQHIDESFLVSLKDCAKYIVRFTDLIELQHNKKIDLQVLQEYLTKARSELGSLGGGNGGNGANGPSGAVLGQPTGLVNNTTQLIKDTISTSASGTIGSSHTEHKKAKLEGRISQLEAEIHAQTELVKHLTNRIINEEYPNWDRFNKRQLKDSMVQLCDEHITFYKDLVDKWGDVEQRLTQRLHS